MWDNPLEDRPYCLQDIQCSDVVLWWRRFMEWCSRRVAMPTEKLLLRSSTHILHCLQRVLWERATVLSEMRFLRFVSFFELSSSSPEGVLNFCGSVLVAYFAVRAMYVMLCIFTSKTSGNYKCLIFFNTENYRRQHIKLNIVRSCSV